MCITGVLKTLKPLSDKGQKVKPEDVALFSGYKPELDVRLIDWALRWPTDTSTFVDWNIAMSCQTVIC
jgi:hypothetical protein